MVDGAKFDGAKAYKDSKVLNMMTVRELHRRYHDETGITFSSMYPGCIAETNLFREKREVPLCQCPPSDDWFRKLFPVFMKYVTGGYVSEGEAGERLAQTNKDGKFVFEVSGAGGAGGDIFENQFSNDVMDDVSAQKMWDQSLKLVGL
ncbi:MAG: hypothetical protein SGPRY_008757 [Prymnesium sp.]